MDKLNPYIQRAESGVRTAESANDETLCDFYVRAALVDSNLAIATAIALLRETIEAIVAGGYLLEEKK